MGILNQLGDNVRCTMIDVGGERRTRTRQDVQHDEAGMMLTRQR
jgi:hypothetical protein